MAQVVAFTLEVDGIELIFKNLEELKKFTKQVNKEFQETPKADAAYKTLQKTLGALKQIQAKVGQETRKAGRESVIAADKGKNSYRAMNAELVNLRDRFKNLSAIERKSKIGQDIIKNITKLDTELKQIDASIGNFQRNVGNYKQALIGIGDVVTGGLITGGIQQIAQELGRVITSSIKKIKEFEVAQKALQSITGLTNEGLAELSKSALDISVRFGTAATEVLKGFAIIGSKKPELLESAEALAAVSEQAEILSKAAGLTFPEAADVLTKSLNQFGKGADSAREFVDILATSQQKGTSTILSLGEAFKNAGAAVEASNLTFEDGNLLLQALAKGGLEGAEAGTKLRNILVTLAKTGREELNPATADLNDILEILASEITDLSDATDFFDKRTATAALTLIKQRDVVATLTNNLNQYGNALGQAINNTDTLQGSLDKAGASFDAFVLSLKEGDGVLSTFGKQLISTFANVLDSLRGANEGLVDFTELAKIALTSLIPIIGPFLAIGDLAESSFIKAGTAAGKLRLQLDKVVEAARDITDPLERQKNTVQAQTLVVKLLEARLQGLNNISSEYKTTVQILEKAQKGLIVQQQILAAQLDPLAAQQRILIEGLKEDGATVDQIAENTGLSVQKINKVLGITAEVTKEIVTEQKELQKQVEIAAKNIDKLTRQLEKLGAIDTSQNEAQLEESAERRIKALVGTPEQITKQTELLRLQLDIELAKLQRTVFKAQLEDIEILIPVELQPDRNSIPEGVKKVFNNFLDELDKEIDDRGDEVKEIGEALAISFAEGFSTIQLDVKDILNKAFDKGEFDELFNLLEGLTGLTTFDDIFGIFLTDDSILDKVSGTFLALNEGLDGLLERSNKRAEQETESIERRYDREIELAKGNTIEVARLEKEKDTKIKKIEKDAFERNKKIQIAQAGTALAAGIVNIFAAPTVIPDPFGTIFKVARVAFLLTTFAQQIAAINSTKFAEGGYTGLGSGRPDSTGKRPVGVVHEKEYVVSEKVLGTKEGVDLVSKLEKIRKGFPSSDFYRSKGFYVDGGIVNTQLDPRIPIQSVQVINNVVSTEASFTDEQFERYAEITKAAVTEGVIEGTIQSQEEVLIISDRVTRLENVLN